MAVYRVSERMGSDIEAFTPSQAVAKADALEHPDLYAIIVYTEEMDEIVYTAGTGVLDLFPELENDSRYKAYWEKINGAR